MFDCEPAATVAFELIMLVVMLDIDEVVIVSIAISVPVVLLVMTSVAELGRSARPVSVAVTMDVSGPELVAISALVVSALDGVAASVAGDVVASQGIEMLYVAQAELAQVQAATHGISNCPFALSLCLKASDRAESSRLTLLISNTSACRLNWPLKRAEVLAKTFYISRCATCASGGTKSGSLLRLFSSGCAATVLT